MGPFLPADWPGPGGLIETAVSHYQIDRSTAGGRTGKQSQQSLRTGEALRGGDAVVRESEALSSCRGNGVPS